MHRAGNPALLGETPAEVIDRRTAGRFSGEDMVQVLLDWNVAFGRVPVGGGVSAGAYGPGCCGEIERAYYRGLLIDDEIGWLMERNRGVLEPVARSAWTPRVRCAATIAAQPTEGLVFGVRC